MQNYKSALVGQRFAKLVVIFIPDAQWRVCRCDCGRPTVVLRSNLTTGNTTSCGCVRYQVERSCSTTHGQTAGKCWTRAYRIWHGMIQRCCNPNNPNYHRYGGRGVSVCTEWRNSFETFLRDMGQPPTGYSIDRIDNEGPYSRANCRWATEKQQQRNKRSNRLITSNGKTQSLAAWSEETGIDYLTLHSRLKRHWPIERLFEHV